MSSTLLDHVGLPTEAGINTQARCPVVILADTSDSMTGQKIGELNKGLRLFSDDLKSDPIASLRVEPLVIPFSTEVGSDRTWVTADDFQPRAFKAEGITSLAAAVIAGLDAIEDRKQFYHGASLSYYRPWMFIVTDGLPTDPNLLPEAIKRTEQAESMRKCSVFCIGVQGADMATLARLSPARPALELDGVKFGELFLWLSSSLKVQTNSAPGQQVPFPSISGWTQTPK